MAELKTKKTKASVKEFIQSIPDEGRRKDSLTVLKLMESITGSKASIWGTRIVGFGDYHYVSGSGREGDWFLLGFAPRNQEFTIYTMGGLEPNRDLLDKLGKFKARGSCLYIRKLEDVNLKILEQLLVRTVKALKNKK
ncbi:MAG TPA: DUF1801 domain-containing protein [Bacteroidetes bacterium]|nr:MAG: hypothetical protein A2X66_02555 [Ignavibacteria bacterium GWA2_54_16]HCA81525.1 DUF1801 domain-containing protein [Bacteroidota bacterium]